MNKERVVVAIAVGIIGGLLATYADGMVAFFGFIMIMYGFLNLADEMF